MVHLIGILQSIPVTLLHKARSTLVARAKNSDQLVQGRRFVQVTTDAVSAFSQIARLSRQRSPTSSGSRHNLPARQTESAHGNEIKQECSETEREGKAAGAPQRRPAQNSAGSVTPFVPRAAGMSERPDRPR